MKRTALVLWGCFIPMAFSMCHSTSQKDRYLYPDKVYDIELVSKNGREITFDEKNRCDLIWDNDTLPCTAHCRGGGSSRYYKHSFSIKLSDTASLLRMPASKKWILNATYIDKTFLRHKLSYDIFRQMHPDNRAPLCQFANLAINGQYAGLYVVMEKLDEGTLCLSKRDTSAVIFKEPPLFFEGPIVPQYPDNYNHQKYPKVEIDDRSYQHDQLHRLIFESDDSLFANRVGQVFDLRNIADWHILLLLTNNSDGILKNYYLYKADDHTPFRIAPWDYDHSFGRDGDAEYNMLMVNVNMERNRLVTRLMRMPSYRQLVAQRWNEARQKGLISVEHLTGMVSANAKLIETAAKRDAELWPVDDPYYYDYMVFEEEIELMKVFIGLNIPRLDHYFNNINNKINYSKVR